MADEKEEILQRLRGMNLPKMSEIEEAFFCLGEASLDSRVGFLAQGEQGIQGEGIHRCFDNIYTIITTYRQLPEVLEGKPFYSLEWSRPLPPQGAIEAEPL